MSSSCTSCWATGKSCVYCFDCWKAVCENCCVEAQANEQIVMICKKCQTQSQGSWKSYAKPCPECGLKRNVYGEYQPDPCPQTKHYCRSCNRHFVYDYRTKKSF